MVNLEKDTITIEEVRSREWDRLAETAKKFGVQHAHALRQFLTQCELFSLEEINPRGISYKIRKELVEENPDKLVVYKRVMDDFRYQAGIEASLMSREEVDRNRYSVMWDHVIDSAMDGDIGAFDLFSNSHILTDQEAAEIFAWDYQNTAEDRLLGRRLAYNIQLEGEI